MRFFETIGSATVIAYDDRPVLTTDAWVEGDAYFGSWGLDYEIPAQQMQAIRDAQYHWFSHGHPDHTNVASDRKSTRLNSSHVAISYAVFCLKKKKKKKNI